MGAPDAMRVRDDKSFAQHHPTLGYTYRPGSDLELAAPAGRRYRLRVNAAGIRSDRDYAEQKPAGVFRIIALGDSFAAGQFVDNALRFSEILERRHENLEVINLALDGTGTDQQLLAYEEFAPRFEHDLVLILPFLQNIRRNLLEARESFAPGTGERILIPKPRFALNDGALELKNVPVPETRLPAGESASDLAENSQATAAQNRSRLSALAERLNVKRLAYSLVDWEPFPEYRDEVGEAWQVMAAILRRLKQSAGERPLAIAPIFYLSYVRYRMALNYLDRFESLAGPGTGISVIDLLPHFKSLNGGADRCFYEPFDCHFSPHGHLALADGLEGPLRRLGVPC